MPELYYLKKNFLNKEDCNSLIKIIESDTSADQRKGYEHKAFTVQDFYAQEKIEATILKPVIAECAKTFTENYSFNYNRFELKRLFGNIMHPGAINEPHDDDGDVYPGKPEVEEHYSAILMLTSDYTGGDLYFEHHNKQVHLEQGDLIMFRGNAENLHGVREVLSGKRINVIIFFRNYPLDRKINGDQWEAFMLNYGAS